MQILKERDFTAVDMGIELGSYDTIVGYGIGQNYERFKKILCGRIAFDYLADEKWENTDIQKYDGIPVIRLQQLKEMKNVLVVLLPESCAIREIITREISDLGFDICYIHDLLPFDHCVNGKDLIGLLPSTVYQDEFHNKILFDKSVSPNIKIYFWGENNFLNIEEDVSINHLEIYYGNNGKCVIGKDTSIVEAVFHVSEGLLDIGKDCMLSNNILIRTHDNHHIFSKDTRERINYAKDVRIGNQVWIGYGAALLAGAAIGAGSVVAEKAVTSSTFGDHVVIAGCPARIVRENIYWSRDNTFFFNRHSLNDCIDKNALKYL